MTSPDNYKRPALPYRPWLSGKLYDDFSRSTILHCDAFVFAFGGHAYLMLDWREGGTTRVALDGYMIEPDGLTPVWDVERMALHGRPLHWSRGSHSAMRRVHVTTLGQGERMLELGRGRWGRVVTLAHYVQIPEGDPEPGHGEYRERGPYKPRVSTLPDIL